MRKAWIIESSDQVPRAMLLKRFTLAGISEMLPNPPITRNQVELMQVDNVCSPEIPGFGQLGISPHSVEEILQQMLKNR